MVLKTTLHVLFFPDMNFKKPDCIYYIDCKHYAAIAACAMELAPRHKEVPITHRFLLNDLKEGGTEFSLIDKNTLFWKI